ncbi:MAG: insulinase family protein [Firmicutes bacterium]|jgi:predicted Zn-dependent peptidase|nr:insulinase family protein [Bacillota bacterium]
MEKQYVTNNGMEIFHYPGNHLHSFCVSLYFKAGSLYETEAENGITHFLEHVVIRNINFLMGGKLYGHLDRLGLMFNACTYKEFVQFELTGARVHIREAMDVLVKVFEPICLPAAEIKIERNRIKAEIREEDEKNSLGFFTGNIVWEGTSLARSITGQSTRLDKMGKAVLRQAHSRLLSPANGFFYVTGHAWEEDLAYLKQAVERYGPGSGSDLTPRRNFAPLPRSFFHRNGRVAVKKSKDTVIRFSFDIDTRKYSQAAYVLLYDILFDCENSKIHQALSEQSGYIYSFDPGLEQYSNIGNLYFQYEVQPARLLGSAEIVMKLFYDLKQGIRDELDYVKPVYIDNAELILDHASNLNWAQAYEGHILEKGSRDPKERKQEYEAVSPEEITALAREVFTCKNLVVAVKGKKSKKLEQDLENIVRKLDEE